MLREWRGRDPDGEGARGIAKPVGGVADIEQEDNSYGRYMRHQVLQTACEELRAGVVWDESEEVKAAKVGTLDGQRRERASRL